MKIFISVVAYAGIEDLTGECLKRAMLEASARGHELCFSRCTGHSLIANARNWELAEFRRSDSDMMISIDSDVGWEPGDLFKLAEYPVDLVAGIYPARKDPVEYRVEYLDRPELWADPETGLLELAGVPAGFLKISRTCVERMCTYYADRVYQHQMGKEAWCIFDCGLDNGLYWGEDLTFCKRWRDIGGKVWCNPEFLLHHVGLLDTMKPELGKKVWSGRFGDWLRNRPAPNALGNGGGNPHENQCLHPNPE